MEEGATRHCPYCQEEILRAAVKCKHCREDLDVQPPAPPSRSRRRGLWVAMGILTAGFIGSIAWLLDHASDNANAHKCRSNAKQIGLAFALYQQRERGQLPDLAGDGTLRMLHDRGGIDVRIFRCPSSVEADLPPGTFATSFTTWQGGAIVTPFDDFAMHFPLAWEKEPSNHSGIRHVVFLNGFVERMDEARLDEAFEQVRREGWLR